ncbi:hypothetical protein HK097_000031 [Rhizophlyctis rosea]|uniref:Uncharacterized protein n=1 Tax=Rhizophlyctis rosea TaxID=64517 RepID=A0AAD5SS65_9FUNG|nr:hypothetical protein HK097_000031 [Rhizophlyctis rosea]
MEDFMELELKHLLQPAHPELFDFGFEAATSIADIKGNPANNADVTKQIPQDVPRYETEIADAPGSVEDEVERQGHQV